MKKYECGLSWVKVLQDCDLKNSSSTTNIHFKHLFPKNPYEKCLIEEFEQELIKIIFDYAELCTVQLLFQIACCFYGLETDARLKFLLAGIAEQYDITPLISLNTYHICGLITTIERRSAELTKGA